MKKTLCAFLCFLLTFAFTACGPESGTSLTPSGDESTTDYWQQHELEIKNFVVQTFGEDYWKYASIEFANHETEGTVVDVAAYNRTALLEENYGITIDVVYTPHENRYSDLQAAIQSGDCDYHVIADNMITLKNFVNAGLAADLAAIDTIDLSRDYYDQACVTDLSVGNSLPMIVSDATLTDKMATWLIYYNKGLVTEYGLEDPYALVDSGKWTIDKMFEMAKSVSTMTSGVPDLTSDVKIGFIGCAFDGVSFTNGFGEKMVVQDDKNLPVFNMSGAVSIAKWNTVFDYFLDESTSFLFDRIGYSIQPDTANVFFGGRALFMTGRLESVFEMIEKGGSSLSFGFLPMPKYNEEQARYYSLSTISGNIAMSVPSDIYTEKELEDIGFFIDALSYYGKKLIRPALYDITLKQQKADTEADAAMLDLLFENRIWDQGLVYDFGRIQYIYPEILLDRSNTNSITSKIESFLPAIELDLDAFRERYE